MLLKALRTLRHYQYQISPHVDTPEFRDALKRIAEDQYPLSKTLKHDGTTTVSEAEITRKQRRQKIVIKRYNTKNKLHFFRRLFRASRAENCWKMSAVFIRHQIHTPNRLATIQERFGPFKLRSWYLCDLIEGIDLLDYFNKNTEPAHLEEIKPLILSLFTALSENSLSHGDMKATNILLSGQTLYLIDLDASKNHTQTKNFQRAFEKDWRRFMKNWSSQTEVSSVFKPLEPIIFNHTL